MKRCDMKIIVCIKQVPDTADIRIDPETNTLIREGVRAVTNVFDLHAIEEGLKLRERFGGSVKVISMGPPQATKTLQAAIAMGANEAILVSSRAFAGSDTWATSYTLAQAIKKIADFDIILCGKQAVDGDTAQVGPGIAAHLNIPQVTYVEKIRDIDNGKITLERMREGGLDIIEAHLPCLITVLKEINVPRYESFIGKIMAKKEEIKIWDNNDLDCDPEQIGLNGSPTQVKKIFPPPVHKATNPLPGNKKNIEKTAQKVASYIRGG